MSTHPINPLRKSDLNMTRFLALPCAFINLALGVLKSHTPLSQPRFNIVSWFMALRSLLDFIKKLLAFIQGNWSLDISRLATQSTNKYTYENSRISYLYIDHNELHITRTYFLKCSDTTMQRQMLCLFKESSILLRVLIYVSYVNVVQQSSKLILLLRTQHMCTWLD